MTIRGRLIHVWQLLSNGSCTDMFVQRTDSWASPCRAPNHVQVHGRVPAAPQITYRFMGEPLLRRKSRTDSWKSPCRAPNHVHIHESSCRAPTHVQIHGRAPAAPQLMYRFMEESLPRPNSRTGHGSPCRAPTHVQIHGRAPAAPQITYRFMEEPLPRPKSRTDSWKSLPRPKSLHASTFWTITTG